LVFERIHRGNLAIQRSRSQLRYIQVDDNVNVDSISNPRPRAADLAGPAARSTQANVGYTMSQQYTITELAREFDVTPRAIRFYEDQGLLAPSREGSSGLRRVYSSRDRTRLKLTLRGKRLGFTLSEIRSLLDLYESPTDTVSQLHAFLATIAEHREVLERQLQDLNATLEDLAQYEAQCRAMLAENDAKSDA
jgi:DNA-binding transcriptional MerR regulator